MSDLLCDGSLFINRSRRLSPCLTKTEICPSSGYSTSSLPGTFQTDRKKMCLPGKRHIVDILNIIGKFLIHVMLVRLFYLDQPRECRTLSSFDDIIEGILPERIEIR